MAVLKRRRDAALRRSRIYATSHDTGTQRYFKSAVNRELHRQRRLFVDDRLVRLRQVVDGDTQPRDVGEEQSAHRKVDERLLKVSTKNLRRLRADEIDAHGIRLIAERKAVEVYIARIVSNLEARCKAEVLGEPQLV